MSGTSVPYEPGAHPIGAPIKTPNEGHTILSDDEIRRALTRIAFEILESNKGTDNLVLLGIRSRGYPLAQRLAQRIQTNDSNFDLKNGLGALDITSYRDDLTDEEYETTKMWFSSMMFSTPAALFEPPWTPLTNTDVRLWCVLPCWWIVGTGNSQFAPTMWGKTFRPVP